jgi:hypothetical protein
MVIEMKAEGFEEMLNELAIEFAKTSIVVNQSVLAKHGPSWFDEREKSEN